MKIHGKTPEINRKAITFERPSGNVTFVATAVLDYESFESLYPRPEAPEILHRELGRIKNPDDSEYNKLLEKWASAKIDWMQLKALEGTDGLEWETVVMEDPTTWGNFRKELAGAGFTEPDQMRLFNVISEVCGLTEARIENATDTFLAELAADQLARSQNTEPSSMESGEPASG